MSRHCDGVVEGVWRISFFLLLLRLLGCCQSAQTGCQPPSNCVQTLRSQTCSCEERIWAKLTLRNRMKRPQICISGGFEGCACMHVCLCSHEAIWISPRAFLYVNKSMSLGASVFNCAEHLPPPGAPTERSVPISDLSPGVTMKYVVVSGGVVSGLGKGITSSSIGLLLRSSGLRVTSLKIDPYLVSCACSLHRPPLGWSGCRSTHASSVV